MPTRTLTNVSHTIHENGMETLTHLLSSSTGSMCGPGLFVSRGCNRAPAVYVNLWV